MKLTFAASVPPVDFDRQQYQDIYSVRSTENSHWFSRTASIMALASAALLVGCGGGGGSGASDSVTAQDASTDSASTENASPTVKTAAETTTTTSWTTCATERQTCSFTGTRSVRYGTTTNYVTRSFTGGVACSNAVFGDPAYGQTKTCWISQATTATTTTPCGRFGSSQSR